MSTFELCIYQGQNKANLMKWMKQDDLTKWQKYQYFYCGGADSVISLDLEAVWVTIFSNKQTHCEIALFGIEKILQGRCIHAKVPFYIELNVTNN